VKDEDGDLVTNCHHILVMWWNHFSELFSVHGVSDLRQTETHTTQPIVPDLSVFEVEMAIEKVKNSHHQEFIKSQQH
jgi:hypothetical protein